MSDPYTGDEYCKDCGKLLNNGEIICLHSNTELRNVSEEYTGDTYCKDCGKLVENGESLLITFTIDYGGYNGDTYYAGRGMTWAESLYNDSLFFANIEKFITQDGQGIASSYVSYYNEVNGGENRGVLCDEAIIENYEYSIWPYK